jgi:xylulokinase
LDANARGAWVGLTAKHQRADLVRSILEGVCYSQKDALEIIARLGAHPSSVRLSGGGAKSSFWHQLFADIFDQRVATLESQEGSAYGAALLAMIGTGEYSDAIEISRAAVKEVSVKEPQQQSTVDFYKRHYETYQSLYPALKATFLTIGQDA